jgi:hypothetical protein
VVVSYVSVAYGPTKKQGHTCKYPKPGGIMKQLVVSIIIRTSEEIKREKVEKNPSGCG